jgi:hypothetical protein
LWYVSSDIWKTFNSGVVRPKEAGGGSEQKRKVCDSLQTI